MRITVAICTWNRAALLERALEAMTELVVPVGVEWELLVVNNNCTDHTDEVVAALRGRLPIRLLYEPTPGKSHALNLAVREAWGDYILWTDDDALVQPDWLSEYCRAFGRWPEAAVFGGPVEPRFAQTPPLWLREVWPRVRNAYAILNLGDSPSTLTHKQYPFGVNMAVRRDYQTRYLYDPALGRRPGSTLPGEETAVVRAMLASGATGWWVPTARVRHYIPSDRCTTRYLRGYFFGQGLYRGRMDPDVGSVRLFGSPRWMWRRAIEAELQYRFARALREPAVWIEALITASAAWGQLRGERALPPSHAAAPQQTDSRQRSSVGVPTTAGESRRT